MPTRQHISPLSRVARAVSLTLFGALLLAFVAVQVQQRLFRHRAERLLAEFQSIRLHQSTWGDTQAFIQRWGAWGHADGPCSATDCKYTVLVGDAYWRLGHRWMTERTGNWFEHALPLYDLLGGRMADLQLDVMVQDGTVWRTSLFLSATIDAHEDREYAHGYTILLSAEATDVLKSRWTGRWMPGSDDQLEDHPNFKIARGNCTGCISSHVNFTPYLSESDLRRVTAYDLSCLTRWHPCLLPGDILPLDRRLVKPEQHESAPQPADPCRIPIYARARDAEAILAVKGLTQRIVDTPAEPIQKQQEVATVQVNEFLKGAPPIQPGSQTTLAPWTTNTNDPNHASEHIVPGTSYLIFLTLPGPSSPLTADFCGVVPDSPMAREQVRQGIAQNDLFRRHERFGRLW